MLLFDFREIGNHLLAFRKKSGMTQEEVAEKAGLSSRTYADIERGNVNMRLGTLLRICETLHVTPDEILTKEREHMFPCQDDVLSRLEACSPKDKETALNLVWVFLQSLTKNCQNEESKQEADNIQ